MRLAPDTYYCGTVERKWFDIGAPTPFVVLKTSIDEKAVEVALEATTADVARTLSELSLPLAPGWTACARAERASEDWAFGQILHVDAFYTKAAVEPPTP